MSKKLLLINPAPKGDLSFGKSVTFMNYPPLNLAYIAALTPRNWEIKLIDENIERYRYEDANLVALTSVTHNAPRAYELASHFRRRGITTVMGGIHASMLPDEVSGFVDSIVTGEAESVWPGLINDFEKGMLKKKYSGARTDLKQIVIPRRDIYSDKYSIKYCVQTARGCPMNCDFCSVSIFNGGLYRQRPVEEVLDELEASNSKVVFFLDDNIVGHGKIAEQRAIALFKGIIERGLNIKWAGQASINFANNDEILKYAYESGCRGLFVGFESLNEASLKSMNKTRNLSTGVKKYKEKIKKFHDNGIYLLGAFVFGSDYDKKDIFKKTSDFILDAGVDGTQLTVLTPLPGTRLYERLKNENRLLYTNYPNDWVYYNVFNVVFRPKNMTPYELRDGILDVYKATASLPKSLMRGINSVIRTKNINALRFAYFCNRGYYRNFAKNIEACDL